MIQQHMRCKCLCVCFIIFYQDTSSLDIFWACILSSWLTHGSCPSIYMYYLIIQVTILKETYLRKGMYWFLVKSVFVVVCSYLVSFWYHDSRQNDVWKICVSLRYKQYTMSGPFLWRNSLDSPVCPLSTTGTRILVSLVQTCLKHKCTFKINILSNILTSVDPGTNTHLFREDV